MIPSADAYPLQWPSGWDRTPTHDRRSSSFKISSFEAARDGVLREVRLMGGTNAVISTNVALRRDERPYANQPEPYDPGAAVYWYDDASKQRRCIACDRWTRVIYNLRAIEKSLNAMRGLDRWGSSEVVERAFMGFAALPPGGTAHGWRDVLRFDRNEPVSEAQLKERYRQLAHELHPDHGGNHDQMLKLNEAQSQALAEIVG